MYGQKRIRDYNIVVGSFQTGKRNAIQEYGSVTVFYPALNYSQLP